MASSRGDGIGNPQNLDVIVNPQRWKDMGRSLDFDSALKRSHLPVATQNVPWRAS